MLITRSKIDNLKFNIAWPGYNLMNSRNMCEIVDL